MRRGARRDKHEPDIIAALRAVGAVVQQQQPPQPDLLVSFRGQLEQLEVKDHDRSHGAAGQPHRGKRNALEGRMAWLTPAQVTWWTAWLAAGGRPPIIVLDVEEALVAIGALPSDEALIAKVMRTTGATRSDAEQALVDGKRLAERIRKATELPAELVSDAIAVHQQRKPRC